IFPGGRLPTIERVEEESAKAGFTLTRRQSLQPHYAKTLDAWAEGLQARRDEAIAIQSEEVYDRYMHYLTGCAKGFRAGNIDVDLNLDKLDLRPGMTVLDIGCGWGVTMKRALEKYDVNVIGLTLSKEQLSYCTQLLDKVGSDRQHEVRLEGWEQFHQPVDRI